MGKFDPQMSMGGITGEHWLDLDQDLPVKYECEKTTAIDCAIRPILDGADCVMICVDISSRESLGCIEFFVTKISQTGKRRKT